MERSQGQRGRPRQSTYSRGQGNSVSATSRTFVAACCQPGCTHISKFGKSERGEILNYKLLLTYRNTLLDLGARIIGKRSHLSLRRGHKLLYLYRCEIMDHYLQIKYSMVYYSVMDSSQRVLSLLSHFYCVHAAKTKLLKSHLCEESTKLFILCSFEIMDCYLLFIFPMVYHPVVDSSQRV